VAQTPEGKVKKLVKAKLAEYGCYQHWPVQAGYGAACLDCHGCHEGAYFAVETKAPGKHMTPRQTLTAVAIREAGGVVFVVGESHLHGVYSGMKELEQWLNRRLR
jgi:hypothetical protein